MEPDRQGMPLSLQRGVALVIALILLFTLSVLVVMSVSTASAELVMAGNEQFGRNASHAAGAGIEQALVRFASGAAVSDVTGNVGADRYSVAIRRRGEEGTLPQSSAEKFVGLHYEIESTGSAARRAIDVQVQGVLVIDPAGSARTFARTGEGLQP